jgi:hypothetical protein
MTSKKLKGPRVQGAEQQARREFLEKAGKLAAYTPPLMLGLLMPGQHAIASGTRIQVQPGEFTEKEKKRRLRRLLRLRRKRLKARTNDRG